MKTVVSSLFVLVVVLCVVTILAQTPPPTPPKTYQVPLSWTWNQGNGPAATGFIVERRARPVGDWAEVQRAAADKRVVTDSAPAGTFEYRVSAFNPMDRSAPSAPFLLIVGPPATPQNLILQVQAAVSKAHEALALAQSDLSTALAQLGQLVGTGE